MARQTLPRGDLLSLVGAGAAARAPEEAPLLDPKIEHSDQPQNGNDAKPIARRAIAPKGKAAGGAHAETHTPRKQPVPVEPSRKQKFNSRLAPELADAVRDCVVALSGPPERLTIDSFAAEAFRREVERLKKAHNGGRDFPPREYAPKPGRPIKR